LRTLLLPLDERPCNFLFPRMIADSGRDITLVMPEKQILSDRKKPADISLIENFLLQNAGDCTNIVLSVDMLVYGGLIPSRLHYLKTEEALSRLEIIKKIKNANPKIIIYAFNCIMRTPQYNSSEEEPDYYAEYGYNLFKRKYLLDYQTRRGGLDKLQLKELKKIKIPQNIINDYEARRNFNELVNIEILNFLETGIIDFLVIPQDDSSPYGYTAISQKRITCEIKRKKLDMKVMVYPGADEVALSLLTRAWHDYKNIEPKVFSFYASVLGPAIVPLFEDRPMYESLKSHLRVCRCKPAENAQEADFILAINCPGKIPQDTYDEEIDISYTSCRNLQDFVYQIRDYLGAGKKVAVCDSAFCNGGDIQLIRYLDELDILDKLISYAGWNTNCNTLGTTLSQACIGKDNALYNLLYRIIDDVCYQSAVRHEVIAADLPEYNLEDYNLTPALSDIENIILKKLHNFFKSLYISNKYFIIFKGISLPWKRMFEIEIDMEIAEK